MPRVMRGLADNHIYHVSNRGNGRQSVFQNEDDYSLFVELLAGASQRHPVHILAYCLLPDHFHLLLQPEKGEDLSRWMQWLMTSHVRQFHRLHNSRGHIWQGRFKSFLVKENHHLLTVARYVEGNPVQMGLVSSAADWRWSSHCERLGKRKLLGELPVSLPDDWPAAVNQTLTDMEFERLGQSMKRQAPFGDDEWRIEMCNTYGLESTIRKRGRPLKG